MNYLKLLQIKFLLLPSRVRLVLVVSVIFFVALFAYYSFRPNPNGWEKISKIGITLPLKYKLHGIDVSHHNGKIEWQKVEKMQFSDKDLRIEFCFLKATEGMTHSDREFERNWEQLSQAIRRKNDGKN